MKRCLLGSRYFSAGKPTPTNPHQLGGFIQEMPRIRSSGTKPTSRTKPEEFSDTETGKLTAIQVANLFNLRASDPERWTPEQLAESFSVSVSVVKTLIETYSTPLCFGGKGGDKGKALWVTANIPFMVARRKLKIMQQFITEREFKRNDQEVPVRRDPFQDLPTFPSRTGGDRVALPAPGRGHGPMEFGVKPLFTPTTPKPSASTNAPTAATASSADTTTTSSVSATPTPSEKMPRKSALHSLQDEEASVGATVPNPFTSKFFNPSKR